MNEAQWEFIVQQFHDIFKALKDISKGREPFWLDFKLIHLQDVLVACRDDRKE